MHTCIHAELGTILEKCIIDTITITHFFLIIDTSTSKLGPGKLGPLLR